MKSLNVMYDRTRLEFFKDNPDFEIPFPREKKYLYNKSKFLTISPDISGISRSFFSNISSFNLDSHFVECRYIMGRTYYGLIYGNDTVGYIVTYPRKNLYSESSSTYSYSKLLLPIPYVFSFTSGFELLYYAPKGSDTIYYNEILKNKIMQDFGHRMRFLLSLPYYNNEDLRNSPGSSFNSLAFIILYDYNCRIEKYYKGVEELGFRSKDIEYFAGVYPDIKDTVVVEV